jgi:hypothetical protein
VTDKMGMQIIVEDNIALGREKGEVEGVEFEESNSKDYSSLREIESKWNRYGAALI